VASWLQAILLGLVEGLTEFIPVSSTGHLLLAERWLGAKPDWFTVFIQVGAALALVPLFWTRLLSASRDYLLKLIVAFGITGAGGLVLHKLRFELPETVGPVAWATLIGGVVIIAIERWRSRVQPMITSLTWGIAITCGFAQLVAAVFPGTSRSGITIMAAIAMGLVRAEAAEFSFILGIVTLVAAGGYKFLGAWRHGEIQGGSAVDVALAFVAAAISAFLVVRWLLGFVRAHSFNGFAWYRIMLGGALLVWFRG